MGYGIVVVLQMADLVGDRVLVMGVGGLREKDARDEIAGTIFTCDAYTIFDVDRYRCYAKLSAVFTACATSMTIPDVSIGSPDMEPQRLSKLRGVKIPSVSCSTAYAATVASVLWPVLRFVSTN